MHDLAGTFTALVTPFDSSGAIDEKRLREQVDFQIDAHVTGVVPVGTTGESPTLDMDEHKRVIDIVCEQVAGRVLVIAGVGGNATAEALELHAHAKAAGATHALSVNPYYNKPTQEGLYRHFATLAEKVDLPIMLYNIPGRTSVTMTPATVARLHATGRVPAIKEATGSCDLATEIMQTCGITVLSGDDPLTLPLISLGGQGVVSVVSNLVPKDVVAMVQAAATGNWPEARRLHFKLFALTKSLFLDGNPAGVKHAMKHLHRDTGTLRLPLTEPGDEARATIERELADYGLTASTS
jgi:4-hydroxy-tetrahydrodipicolinate synthase